MMSALVIALMVLALSGPTVAFVPMGGGASTHLSITRTALLQKVTETCQAVVEAAGHEFKPTVGNEITMCIQWKLSHTTCRNTKGCWPLFQHIFVV